MIKIKTCHNQKAALDFINSNNIKVLSLIPSKERMSEWIDIWYEEDELEEAIEEAMQEGAYAWKQEYDDARELLMKARDVFNQFGNYTEQLEMFRTISTFLNDYQHGKDF